MWEEEFFEFNKLYIPNSSVGKKGALEEARSSIRAKRARREKKTFVGSIY